MFLAPNASAVRPPRHALVPQSRTPSPWNIPLLCRTSVRHVEGLTEFLPISSTGHLIVAGSLLGYAGEQAKVFEIVIQAGAILAVCWEFRMRLLAVAAGVFREPRANRFVVNLAVAFMPAAVLGLAFGKLIKSRCSRRFPSQSRSSRARSSSCGPSAGSARGPRPYASTTSTTCDGLTR